MSSSNSRCRIRIDTSVFLDKNNENRPDEREDGELHFFGLF